MLGRGSRWEVDEFLGANAGLVVADSELTTPDQPFARPDWLGEEVTEDPRYYNANLDAMWTRVSARTTFACVAPCQDVILAATTRFKRSGGIV